MTRHDFQYPSLLAQHAEFSLRSVVGPNGGAKVETFIYRLDSFHVQPLPCRQNIRGYFFS